MWEGRGRYSDSRLKDTAKKLKKKKDTAVDTFISTIWDTCCTRKREITEYIGQRGLNAGDLLLTGVMEMLRSLGQWRKPEIISSRKPFSKGSKRGGDVIRVQHLGPFGRGELESRQDLPKDDWDHGTSGCLVWMEDTAELKSLCRWNQSRKRKETTWPCPLLLLFWQPPVPPKGWASVDVRKQGSLRSIVHSSQSPKGTEFSRGRVGGMDLRANRPGKKQHSFSEGKEQDIAGKN